MDKKDLMRNNGRILRGSDSRISGSKKRCDEDLVSIVSQPPADRTEGTDHPNDTAA